MTTVKAFIRTGKKDKEANIRFRISSGRKVQLFHKSELVVLPALWDDKREQYKSKSVIRTDERVRLILLSQNGRIYYYPYMTAIPESAAKN